MSQPSISASRELVRSSRGRYGAEASTGRRVRIPETAMSGWRAMTGSSARATKPEPEMPIRTGRRSMGAGMAQ